MLRGIDRGSLKAEVLGVEQGCAKGVHAWDFGHLWDIGKASRDDELFGTDHAATSALPSGNCLELPLVLFCRLHASDEGVETNSFVDTELFGVAGEVIVENRPWDMLSWLDSEGCRVHWEVWVLVGTEHVVGLEAWV